MFHSFWPMHHRIVLTWVNGIGLIYQDLGSERYHTNLPGIWLILALYLCLNSLVMFWFLLVPNCINIRNQQRQFLFFTAKYIMYLRQRFYATQSLVSGLHLQHIFIKNLILKPKGVTISDSSLISHPK